MTVLDPKVTVARKNHACFACGTPISKGQTYIAYPGTNNEGAFQTTRLCIECSYLLTQKTGANAHNIRQGEFSERFIPNCLRKKRTEFRRDPRNAIESAGLLETRSEPEAPKLCRQIVVKQTEFDRRVFHLPESRFKVDQFVKGNTITIKAGVNGQSRNTRIIGAWSTDGSGFGCEKRQVAILVA